MDVNADTMNKRFKIGTNKTKFKNTMPAANAPRLAGLPAKPNLKIECLLLQLNPWIYFCN